MKRLISITTLFLVIAMLWQGCKKEEQTGSIYGTVTDYATGEPVKNANVKLRPGGETTLTGSDGSYSFQDLKKGQYSLSLSKAEYEDLEDDYVIDLAAGKSVCRDVQMKKKVALLRITDVNGNDIGILDFGADESVISKSFNIFNESTQSIACMLSYSSGCNWLVSVTNLTEPIVPGQTVPIIVTIDRTLLAGGENSTILHITSNYGSNELEIRATGIGGASVTTANVTNITATTAVCGGNVTSDGGGTVTERGVCWSLNPSPSLENGNHKSMGSGIGSFSNTITGLSPNTPYYVRAYATNGSGTSYGEEKMFTTEDGLPTVTTTTASNIMATTATSGGNVTGNGGFPVTARGICWNTGGYPDISDPHTTSGAGNGSFTANITGLDPGTTYHVRAYATNSMGTSYGQDLSFSTPNGLPTVTVSVPTNTITATNAVLSGNVTSDYGSAITERGFCWSTNQYPTVNDSHTTVGSGAGSFTGSATNLTPSTTYYVRAYARNSYGLNYSPQTPFQTTSGLPTVTTTNPTRTGTTVTTGGNVTSDGGFSVTARGVCWGTTPYPDLSSAHHYSSNGGGTGSFSSTFEMPNTGIYYIRAYATNVNGTSYGEQKQINHPYNDLPTFTFGGQTYRVAPAATTTMNWANANTYCESLTLHGFSDWRLPSVDELYKMYQLRNTIGGFNTGFWWSNTQCHYYYGSSGNNGVGHYEIGFSHTDGSQSCFDDSQLYYVRPIRVEQ